MTTPQDDQAAAAGAAAEPTLLQRFLHWEAVQPEVVALTEPRPDGTVVDFTWREVGDQARRMATHLRSLGLPPASSSASRRAVSAASRRLRPPSASTTDALASSAKISSTCSAPTCSPR